MDEQQARNWTAEQHYTYCRDNMMGHLGHVERLNQVIDETESDALRRVRKNRHSGEPMTEMDAYHLRKLLADAHLYKNQVGSRNFHADMAHLYADAAMVWKP